MSPHYLVKRKVMFVFEQDNAPAHVKVIQENYAHLCVGEVIESYMLSVAQLLHNPYSRKVIGRNVKPRLHDTTGCQTGYTTGFVKPVI